MPTLDPRVDAYIARAAPFAGPILENLRRQVHRGCPAVVETIKWRMPFFDYRGVLCGMAAFKAHCAFVFWRDVKDVVPSPKSNEAMGQLGRITSLADLPKNGVLTGYVRAAAARRDVPAAWRGPMPRRPVKAPAMPADLRQALAANPRAGKIFQEVTPGYRRAYVNWITEAKRPETRRRRIAAAVNRILAGERIG